MTIYSVDVGEMLPTEKIEISLNQKNKTLIVQFENNSYKRRLKIRSRGNRVAYSGVFLNQYNIIELNKFAKGIYSLEIISNNNKIVKEFELN